MWTRLVDKFKDLGRRIFPRSLAPSRPPPLPVTFEKWPLPSSSFLPTSGVFFVETIYTKSTMFVPKKIIFAWNVNEKPKKDEQSGQVSQCFLFSVYTTEKPHLITMRRPVEEHYSETVQKIIFKMDKALGFPGSFSLPKSSKLNLIDALEDTKRAEVNGETFSVSLHPPHVSSFTCVLRPFVDCPYISAIDIVAQDKSNANFNLQWYVKELPSTSSDVRKKEANQIASASIGGQKKRLYNKEPQEDLRIKLNQDKSFSVEGCSYRSTGEVFTPQKEDEGKTVVALIEMGENQIAKCHESKYPITALDEPLLSDSQIRWCHENKPPEGAYRVVLYNLLANLYLNLAQPQEQLFYPYCPVEYQNYEYRYPLLLKLLQEFNGDLMFLSEVDHRMQLRYLPPICQKLGLEGIFQKKGEQVSEGSMIAYRKELFQCISKEGYLLSKLAALEEENQDLRDLLATGEETNKVFTTRPTVLQTAVLKVRSSGDILLCATIHLHHAPQHEHVKTLQTLVAARQIEKVEKSLKAQYPNQPVHLLFGGDLNSEPDGPVYELLKTGFIGKTDQYWALDTQFKPTDLRLSYPLDHISDCFETTNYTKYENEEGKQCGYSGCIDYVWGKGVKKLAVCPMPAMDLIQKYRALPSKISPSDHLPIICHVALDKD